MIFATSTPQWPPFIFNYSNEALQHNANILLKYNIDIDAAIQAHQNAIISYGSEFKHPDQLMERIQDHPH
jgi:ADP-dependent phosphofructokinase/glucokinase